MRLALPLLLVALASPAAALDPEFEALRAAAKKHEAERPKSPPAAPAARPSGPVLAGFMPPAPKGWRLRNNPFDDADGFVDLTRQANADYVPVKGAGAAALDVTIAKHDISIGGGVPKLGLDKASGNMISEVKVSGHVGYLAWNGSSQSGRLSVSAGRYLVIVAGRGVSPDAVSALAAAVDLGKLARS